MWWKMNTLKRAIKWLCDVKINDTKQVWEAVLLIEDLLINHFKNSKKDFKNEENNDKNK